MILYHGTYMFFDTIDLTSSLDNGPVADDTVFNVIDAYFDGDYTKDEAIRRLKAWKCENQISFHTHKAIEKLKLRGWDYAN